MYAILRILYPHINLLKMYTFVDTLVRGVIIFLYSGRATISFPHGHGSRSVTGGGGGFDR